jgi:hypothetical protein
MNIKEVIILWIGTSILGAMTVIAIAYNIFN